MMSAAIFTSLSNNFDVQYQLRMSVQCVRNTKAIVSRIVDRVESFQKRHPVDEVHTRSRRGTYVIYNEINEVVSTTDG